jgi:enoyl-CoA hydratase/carnithine racemase
VTDASPAAEREVIVDISDHIATITLNRPDARNAMTAGMQADMIAALRDLHDDRDVRVVIVTGAGTAFCAGGDTGSMRDPAADEPDSAFDRRAGLKRLQHMVLAVRECEKPVLAAVNGAAVGGGCDLALACDIRFASRRARFGEVFARLGLFPGTGGTYLLPRTVGIAKAFELIWTGDVIDADEAARIGLVTSVVEHELLMSTVRSFASRLAEGPPLALALSKSAVYRGLDTDLNTAFDYAATAESITLVSHDHLEGIAAHREKRPPRFTGR